MKRGLAYVHAEQGRPNGRVRREGEVAAVVTGDLLKRPTVVAQVRQEDRVRAVEEMTRDDHIAARVTTGLLRRPDVAFRAMSDDYPDYEFCLAGPSV
ncbi:DUF6192 family protein [Streptomyces sp. NBC_01351]|uniref:DUF6192 family protein n=1 Tax=Streptomyces sp. NBC_01351 TaxID=2903833 RepID=UPI002E313B64|nr:DUF6192 family protein [Streptomyces sp. NBC_01351]